MAEFDKNEIRRLDGTLLLVFQGVMRTGKAADVAVELGLTNSSISHALSRLRDIFGDPLFLRRPHGMAPTAYAREIAPDIGHALDAMQQALTGAAPFEPRHARVQIRLSVRDSEMAATLPDALADIRTRAPGMTFAVRALTADKATDALRDGGLDLAIGYFPRRPSDLDSRLLRHEGYRVVARRNHPCLKNGLRLADYVAADHLLVAGDGSMRGIVDARLAQEGLSRSVAISLPQFMPALAMVARSDLLATLPAKLVRGYAAALGLDHAAPPIDLRDFDLRVLTHARDRRNAAVQWCVERLVASADPAP